MEGGEYFPDAFVEFTLKGDKGYTCLSFFYTISVNSVWLLFVGIYPGGDVFNSRYALTIVPESKTMEFPHFYIFLSHRYV